MGSADSQFAEWFELYNDGTQDENLAGWKLYEDGGAQAVFTFTKAIGAGKYLLVERVTPSAPDPVPGIDDESGSFGGSGFSNTGEDLVLKDAGGNTVETLSYASGWPGGDASTKETMQWDGAKWITAPGTPKAPTVSSGGGGGSGGGTAAPSGTAATTLPAIKKNEPKIELSIPKVIYTNLSAEYSAKTILEYYEAQDGVFLWNMGDGTVYKSEKPTSIKHTYTYPGTYTISFAYYKAPYEKKPFLSSSVERTVSVSKLSFVVIPNKGFQFINADTAPLDLSGWIIALSDGSTIELPPFSIVGAGKTVIMPFSSFGISSYQSATLKNPDWVSVDSPLPHTTTQKVSAFHTTLAPTPKETSLLAQAMPVSEKEEEKTKQDHTYIKIALFGLLLVIVGALFFVIEKQVAASQQGVEE